jgi:predicted O-methyltransferase YrrM
MAFSLSQLVRHPVAYVQARVALLWHLLFSMGNLRRLKRPESSWDELLDAINGLHAGFFKPLQVRSEILAAMRIFEEHEPRFILEIGTARGGTFFLLTRAATPDAVLISLDLPGGKYGGGYERWQTFVFRKLLRPRQRGMFIQGNSHDSELLDQVRNALNGQMLDLLFIDGDHTYEGVRQDYEMYSKLVRDGGLIAFHDVVRHPESAGCRVDQFWNELKAVADCSEIIEHAEQGWAGIGIARMR